MMNKKVNKLEKILSILRQLNVVTSEVTMVAEAI